MNFSSIPSSVGGYNFSHIQKKPEQLSPKQQAEQRENMSPKERDIQMFSDIAKNNREADKIQSIDTKLKTGKKLTDDEKKELKSKNPELYKEAIKVEQERSAFEKELKNAKTKEDVNDMKINHLNKFLIDVKDVTTNSVIPKAKKLELVMQIGREFNNMMDAHNEFVKSADFISMPDGDEVENTTSNNGETNSEVTTQTETDIPIEKVEVTNDVTEVTSTEKGE